MASMSLIDILGDRPEDILIPNESIRQEALRGIKESMDSLASKYSPMDALHIEGLKADQVWVQAQMVLEGVTEKLNEKYSRLEAHDNATGKSDKNSEAAYEQFTDDSDSGSDLESASDEEDEEADLSLSDGSGMSMDEMEYDEENEEDLPTVSQSRDTEQEGEEADDNKDRENSDEPKEDFDLAEFQQHVLQLEQGDNEEEEDDENIDYFAEVEDPSDDADMHYEDFFAPPPKKSKKTETKKTVKFADVDENATEGEMSGNDEDELSNAMETTRKDLFDDEIDDTTQEEGAAKLSRFEREQLEISRQIEELENENIGEKTWGMKGEAQAKDRPEDSLYHIQFDRNVKPAPVITLESTTSLEDLIKERIRKQKFDDIPRKSEITTTNAKKELPELSDAKSQKSLAELYEEDHMRKENPEYFAKQDSVALDSAHQEIVELFTNVTRKLDALCSWQYTPRAPVPSLSIVSDTQSIQMEEAQPGTLAPESQLAPQEVYKGESATPMANQEMSSSLKRKKRRDKAKSKTQSTSSSGKKNAKEEMFSTLKRGNVTIVDKRGNKRDMRGQEVQAKAPVSAAHIKL